MFNVVEIGQPSSLYLSIINENETYILAHMFIYVRENNTEYYTP